MNKRLLRGSIATLFAFLLATTPGSVGQSQSDAIVIKVATLAPRTSSFLRQFKELDRRLREYTGGKVGFRLYASGISGDETDVMRKMRIGQLDAGMMTSEGVALALPEVNVLGTPGVINNYAQLEAVQKVMLPEFDAAFETKDFKLLAWGEAGEYRYFSRRPITKPADIKAMRPWLWPHNVIMKETWRVIGATPIPLGLGEVYGAIQTKMVDLVRMTSVGYLALQWQISDLSYLTSESNGVLLGAWLMNKSVFDRLAPDVQTKLLELARADNDVTRQQARRADQDAYKALIKQRKMTATKLSPSAKKEFAKVDAAVREQIQGRVYSAELLHRVQQIANQ
jgi:TRAP-type C4-dicarboxylate transport system substrate-binding protein